MSAEWRDAKRTVEVLGRTMAYVDQGEGAPVVLLHGNPTSSFLWRDVIAELGEYRCVAPDLIGMGDSDKLPADDPDRYTFASHATFIDAFMDAIGVDGRVTLVGHDWGSGLAFDWANRHRDRVAAIAYMEGFVKPLDSWDAWPKDARRIFQRMRSADGEELVLERNAFVERILPSSIIRDLTEAEMDEYRRPFTAPGEDRLPTLRWPRSLPIEGEPADVVARVGSYSRWLSQSDDLPKLFVNAEPGSVLVGEQREFCRAWPNQQEVTVPGIHFIQEDSGRQIGRAIGAWLAGGVAGPS